MGLAKDAIGFHVTNTAALGNVTLNTGDSLTVRDHSGLAFLDGVSIRAATAGVLEIRSPRMHDFLHGLRFRTLTGASRQLIPYEADQALYSQDTLTVQAQSGAADSTAGVIEVYYNDLNGVNARLTDWPSIKGRVANLLTIEVATGTGGTTGDWTGSTALNATFDDLKGNTDYAVLGMEVDTACVGVSIKGPDTGNLRCFAVGDTERITDFDYFIKMSEKSGRPQIPVIGSPNKAATFIETVQNVATVAINVTVLLAELAH